MEKQKKCVDLVRSHYESRMDDLREMLESGNEEAYERFNDYGLSFDYVCGGTEYNDGEPYWRYQLSWGGPADEFRFFGDQVSDYQVNVHRVEYWFLDWFDGASVVAEGEDEEFFTDIVFAQFTETGTASHVRREALSDE